jgi:pimeloyl-ACP methyl ester carboxylesterase
VGSAQSITADFSTSERSPTARRSRRRGHRKAALIGSSVGGMTALELAARAPERVAALVLVGTTAQREPRRRRIMNRVLLAIAGLLGPVGSFATRVAVVPEAGHLVALEAPDAVLAEVLPFLDRVWPPRPA